jgi:hypothetical protein
MKAPAKIAPGTSATVARADDAWCDEHCPQECCDRPLAADEAAKLASFERVVARFGGIAKWREFYEEAVRRSGRADDAIRVTVWDDAASEGDAA